MAGNDVVEAFDAFLSPMKQTLGCITSERLGVQGRLDTRIGEVSSVILNRNNPAPLRRSDESSDQSRLYLSVSHHVRIVEAEGDRGPYKVETVKYWYAIDATNEPGGELLSFHWDPELAEGQGPTELHMHLKPRMIHPDAPLPRKSFGKLHIPTGRVSLESVVRFAITELDVAPRNNDWDAVLRRNEDAFRAFRVRS